MVCDRHGWEYYRSSDVCGKCEDEADERAAIEEVLLEASYGGEDIVDMERDCSEAVEFANLPHFPEGHPASGLMKGSVRVTIVWSPEDGIKES